MTEQQWNFAGIEAAASAIQGNVTSIHSLLDEGKQSLTKLAAAWGGSGSEAYQGVQQKWDATATELNNALQKAWLASPRSVVSQVRLPSC